MDRLNKNGQCGYYDTVKYTKATQCCDKLWPIGAVMLKYDTKALDSRRGDRHPLLMNPPMEEPTIILRSKGGSECDRRFITVATAEHPTFPEVRRQRFRRIWT